MFSSVLSLSLCFNFCNICKVGGVRFPGEVGELATLSRGSLP